MTSTNTQPEEPGHTGGQSYQPSNGLEGVLFMAEFCDRCVRDIAAGWNLWSGGENPVGDAVVEIRRRDGETLTVRAIRLDWLHSPRRNDPADIIAYRLSRPLPEPQVGEGEGNPLAEIISDAEIARVHGHANFGSMSPREVVNDGVWKYSIGYTGGHTQLCILLEHGLICNPRPGRYDANLTKKGKRYARALYHIDKTSSEAQAAENAELRAKIKALEEGLLKLANEVGALTCAEIEVREAIGNTNWNILMGRREESLALLTEADHGR